MDKWWFRLQKPKKNFVACFLRGALRACHAVLLIACWGHIESFYPSALAVLLLMLGGCCGLAHLRWRCQCCNMRTDAPHWPCAYTYHSKTPTVIALRSESSVAMLALPCVIPLTYACSQYLFSYHTTTIKKQIGERHIYLQWWEKYDGVPRNGLWTSEMVYSF